MSAAPPPEPQEADRPFARGLAATPSVSLAVLAALVIAAAVAIRPAAVPPAVVPATAGEEVFSAERAREHLREITRAPRPVGSAERARVRSYLVGALEALGLEAEVQEATAVAARWGNRAAAVQNVIGRLPGTEPEQAVLLVAHYDSVPHSYGATDDGNGVAAILETMRVLLQGPPLRSDVIALFTDAEEVGLLGAQAFVAEHPLAERVRVVLNAEGRGNEGPVVMFRASAENGHLVRTLAAAVPGAVANSLTDAVFRHMPNDTDLSVFLEAGLPGMDFASGHGITHYHTPLDNFDQADPRTLQHHGAYLLALARTLGEADLGEVAAPDRIYFTLPLAGVVHYRAAWALPLAILAALLVLGLLAWGFARRRLRPAGAVVGLLGFVVALVVIAGLAHLGWRALAGLLPETDWFFHGSPYDRAFFMTAFAALAIALFVTVTGVLRRWASPAELLAGPLVVWAALAVTSAAALPGGSFVFVWPLLFASGGMAVALTGRPREAPRRAAALTLLALPAVVVVAPVVYFLEVMLTLTVVAAPVLLLMLLLGLLALQLDLLRKGLAWGVPALFATVGLVALGWGLARAGLDADRPIPTGISYVAHLDSGKAYWTSTDPEVTPWASAYLGASPERRTLPDWGIRDQRWVNAAPLLVDAGPEVTVLSSEDTADGRRVRVHIAPRPGTYSTSVSLTGGGTASHVEVDGRRLPAEPQRGRAFPGRVLQLFGTPAAGFEVAFTLPPAAAHDLRVRATTPGLPPHPDAPVPPRPEYQMGTGDFTVVERTILRSGPH